MKVSCFKEWCHVAKTFYDLDGNTAKTVGASCTWEFPRWQFTIVFV